VTKVSTELKSRFRKVLNLYREKKGLDILEEYVDPDFIVPTQVY